MPPGEIGNTVRGSSFAHYDGSLLDVVRSAPRRIAIALTYRNFRLLWMGALASSIGT